GPWGRARTAPRPASHRTAGGGRERRASEQPRRTAPVGEGARVNGPGQRAKVRRVTSRANGEGEDGGGEPQRTQMGTENSEVYSFICVYLRPLRLDSPSSFSIQPE